MHNIKPETMNSFVFILNCLFLILLAFFTAWDAIRGYSAGAFYGLLFILQTAVIRYLYDSYRKVK